MQIISNIQEWQNIRPKLSAKSIGFVPTMGHLHLGHLSLCHRSKTENEISVVSIFINPKQFNDTNDFHAYPRTINQDKELLIQANIDYLFMPDVDSIYSDNYEINVTESILSKSLEGEFRPGHFDGVLTVVLKLFNLIQPTRAYFGEKDYQQLLLVKKMVKALFLPLDVIGCPTLRDSDGLAFSSRNSRLSASQRKQAIHFPRLLQSAHDLSEIKTELQSLGFNVEYVKEEWQRRLAAVWLDNVRLIDNFSLDAIKNK